jgi:hypothetical protein
MHAKVGTQTPGRNRKPRTAPRILCAAFASATLAFSAHAQTWRGGAGAWSDPANWVDGVVPNSPDADVRIDADTSTASAVDLPYTAPALRIHALSIDAGDTLTNSSTIIASGPVSIDGTLSLGGVSFQPALLLDSPSPVTLGGTGTVNLGNPYALLSGENGLLIPSGLLVQGIGSVSAGNRAQLTNYGTIRGSLDLGVHFVNYGSVEAADGGTLRLANQYYGDWKNLGTISVAAGSRLHLGGTFTPADIGTIVRQPGSAVALIGTLNNTGQVLDLDTTTGTFAIVGNLAQIVGGTLSASRRDAHLEISGNLSGTLDGVTLATDAVFTYNAFLHVRNGLVLQDATIDLSNGGKLSNWATLAGPGASTPSGNISGRGEIRLGSYRVGDAISENSVGGVTLGAGIVTHGAGGVGAVNDGTIVADVPARTLTFTGTNRGSIRAVDGGAITLKDATNLGTIHVAAGSTLTLTGTWHNPGSIEMDGGSALLLTGPFATADLAHLTAAAPITATLKTTVDNTAALLDAAAAGGTLELRGATIRGGTLTASGNSRLLISPPDRNGNPNVLDGVTLSPGDRPDGTPSLGTLEVVALAPLTLAGGNRLLIELDPGGAADRLWLSTGDLQLGDGSSLELVPTAALPAGTQFVVATYQGNLTGTFAHVTPGFDVSYATPHQVVVTAVPEPTTPALIALAALTATRSRRRPPHPRPRAPRPSR